MNLNNISLPYPVLGLRDDILPELPEDALTVELQDNLREYRFFVDLKFNNSEISSLINDGKAEYSCEYVCARTMLRKCQKSNSPHFEIVIPRKEINGRINFSCFVSVKETILNYTNSGFNSDYGNSSFKMELGDILVAFPSFHYDADIRYDKLQAAGSFMQIRESSAHNEVFFDITRNKIEILLPTALYRLYDNPAVKGAAEIIHSSLVLNALTYALMNIADYETTTWAKTIYYRLDTEDGFSRDDLEESSKIPALAQRLLKDPYNRLFNSIIINSRQTEEE